MNLLPYRILPPSLSYLKLLYISLSQSLVFCLSVSKCLPIDAVRGPPPLPTSPPARQSKRPKKASSRAQAIAEEDPTSTMYRVAIQLGVPDALARGFKADLKVFKPQ